MFLRYPISWAFHRPVILVSVLNHSMVYLHRIVEKVKTRVKSQKKINPIILLSCFML